MELSREVMTVLHQAVLYAKEKGYEYVTPETILMMLAEEGLFIEAFSACGGDIKLLKEKLEEYLSEYVDKVPEKEPELSTLVNKMLMFAGQSAYNSGSGEVYVRHVVHALWNLNDCYAQYYMEQQDITEADLLQEISFIEGDAASENTGEAIAGQEKPGDVRWKLYAPCLNETLKDVNPLIGREAELERTIQILCRKDKNNPLHIGEPGVGKTAITYGLVQRLKGDEVPDAIKGAKVFALDLGGMLAGTQYRGDFEKRFKKVLSEIGKEEKPIIYIDEIHNLSGAGAVGEGSFDASNMLKPYLSDGRIRFIGATTFEEYKKYFEKNKSLIRRFQNVEIKEPSEEETVEILKGLKGKYETYHGVKYAKGVPEYAVKMSAKYINERFLPDKAIDLIDEAGAYRKLHPLNNKTQSVDRDVINEILTKICRVPIETVETDDVKGLATLEDRIKKKICGQDEAISQVVNAVKFSKAGLTGDNKPLSSLLFVGPTGVGKTEIARQLAAELGVKLIRFDMSEYGEKHAVAKLIGSPAGYVGYEEGGILTEAIRKSPSSVLLLDEIEKAHPDIYNVLLQVMDYATLTDNQGRKADFRNVVIIMTSNAGANRLGKRGIGFKSTIDNSVLMEEVKRTFQPEFRNRLDKIVAFNSMGNEMAALIVDKKLSELSEQLKPKKISVTADKKAKELLRLRGISEEFGAREIDRVIRNDIKPLFVDEILFGKLKNGGKITIKTAGGEFSVHTV
ncbi:MAG: AAA family ATPase [Lachnospiraceae bacterium]|nr:AAA family ATPase [Lachnospiraceae bacterium]